MLTIVSTANRGCQPGGDDNSYRPRHNPAVSTLRERIELLATQAGGQRELSRRSGLDERHVGVILSRLRKNPRADIERETLAALAKGGGASVRWLAEGEGTPDSDDDSRPPAGTDSEVPHMGNALGWPDAEAAVRAKTAFPEEVWEATRKVAPYAIRGIVTESDALELVSMVAKFRDPARMEKQLAEAYQRQKEVLARVEARAAQKGKS